MRALHSIAERHPTFRWLLLYSGILSSLLYTGILLYAVFGLDGYNSASQSVSELFAVDAPSRPIVLGPFLLYSILVILFGYGVYLSAEQSRSLRIAGILLMAKEVEGFLVALFFPMHMRGTVVSFTDTMHIALTSFGVLCCIFPAIAFSAAAFGKWFKVYALGTIVLFLLCGLLTGMEGPKMAENIGTPLAGIWERINIGAFLLWVAVLAVLLLRKDRNTASAVEP